MRNFNGIAPLIILFTVGIFAIVYSIFDILFDIGLFFIPIIIFVVVIVLFFIFLFLEKQKKGVTFDILKDFEKKLKGGLFHYKCPTCNGIFAIKKSKKNNKKPLKLTCPDCGAFGIILPYPPVIEDVIPENKSINADFICKNCGEGITLWAEGKALYNKIFVYSCPFCGKDESLKKA